jgi:hypothetical protein
MKRLHVPVSVDDLTAATQLCSTLFAAEPTVTRPDYAKWMLDDPRGNFAISTGNGKSGLDHLGIQVETQDELHEVYDRLQQANRPVLDQGTTTCCHAPSEKSWIADPQGLSRETFLTSGESTVYGHSVDPGPIRVAAAACCTTETAQGACPASMPERAAEAPHAVPKAAARVWPHQHG